MKITSNEQAKRTVAALAETTALINKEKKYLPELQHTGYLAMLEEHAAKLLRMIHEWKARKSNPSPTEIDAFDRKNYLNSL